MSVIIIMDTVMPTWKANKYKYNREYNRVPEHRKKLDESSRRAYHKNKETISLRRAYKRHQQGCKVGQRLMDALRTQGYLIDA